MLQAVVSLAAMAMMINLSMAANYTVGAPNGGWDQSTDLTTWASSQTFFVGDNLIFQYTTNHDVTEVSKPDFDSCSASNPLQPPHSGGLTLIPLTSAGNRYFICGSAGHCLGGMKVQIDIFAASSPPPSTTPSLPPPPPPATLPLPSLLPFHHHHLPPLHGSTTPFHHSLRSASPTKNRPVEPISPTNSFRRPSRFLPTSKKYSSGAITQALSWTGSSAITIPCSFACSEGVPFIHTTNGGCEQPYIATRRCRSFSDWLLIAAAGSLISR
ncbi:UNVERIFIED_CONTAM: Uclacyanin 1 [Sesamum angustifolium]|uniref:Uclacyanin 1 n=1 Tax=Sesamum angustifolium TaxID=2727405 RepID=A0AAW2PF49_9LAMI